MALFKKYIALSPIHTSHNRLLYHIETENARYQPCGINFFSKILEKIAMYLKLEHRTMFILDTVT